MIIMGIDGSLTSTGVAFIDYTNRQCSLIWKGTIKTGTADNLDARLTFIAREITHYIEKHRPQAVAIESQFMGEHGNGQSENKASQAWGAIVAAVGLSGLTVARYAPSTVKLSVAGCGKAEKQAVAVAVAQILRLEDPLTQMDESDACAVAITHALRSSRLPSRFPKSCPPEAINGSRSSKRPLPEAITRAMQKAGMGR